MSTLVLLCGMGIGALIATIGMFFVVAALLRTSKSVQTKHQAYADRTIVLMEERNNTDDEICRTLKRIACATEAK